MRIRIAEGVAAVAAVLVLSGCAAGGSAGSPASGGSIEVAVTETCVSGSSPDCVEINDESVLVTEDAFRTVDLKSVSADEDQSGNAVELVLTQDGVRALTASTTAASEGGEGARLVIRAGGKAVAEVKVIEPIRGDHATIVLPSDVTVDEFIAATGRA